MNIIKEVKSIDDIFRLGGKTLEELTNPSDTPDEAAYKVLKFGIGVLNGGEKVDPTNLTQDRYEPVFHHEPGVGLVYCDCDGWHADSSTFVGPRLSYLDYDVMLHGIKIMREWYHKFYN